MQKQEAYVNLDQAAEEQKLGNKVALPLLPLNSPFAPASDLGRPVTCRLFVTGPAAGLYCQATRLVCLPLDRSCTC